MLGIIGSKADAINIKAQIGEYLKSLELTMSQEKTYITHARTETARFLGYEISTTQANSKITKDTNNIKRRSINGVIQLRVPRKVKANWIHRYTRQGKPHQIGGYIELTDYEIVETLKKKSKLPNYVVFTSDHGQILGENKSWGHIDLNEYVFKVPFVFMSLHKDNVFSQVEKYPAVISHQEISDLLVNLLGYRHPGKPPPLRRVFVMGYDLDGLEGGLWVELGDKDVGSVQQVIF